MRHLGNQDVLLSTSLPRCNYYSERAPMQRNVSKFTIQERAQWSEPSLNHSLPPCQRTVGGVTGSRDGRPAPVLANCLAVADSGPSYGSVDCSGRSYFKGI